MAEVKEKEAKTERRLCKFPGCGKFLSQYNLNKQCHSHTIGEIQIERKPMYKPKHELVCAPLPPLPAKKEIPVSLESLSPTLPAERKILLAACFHFKISQDTLREGTGTWESLRQRIAVMYLLRQHTSFSKSAIARLMHRSHNTSVRDAVISVNTYPDKYADDLKAIRGYCGFEVPPPTKAAAE